MSQTRELMADDGTQEESLESTLLFLDTFEPLEDAAIALDGDLILLTDEQEEPDAQDEAANMAPSHTAATGLAIKAGNKSVRKAKPRVRAQDFKPNRARNERKEDLLYLRTKVREFEARLEELRSTGCSDSTLLSCADRITARPASEFRDNSVISRASKRQPTFVWEAVAYRQFEERHKAEMENVRLKMVLEGQIKVAKDLEKVLKRRSTAQVSVRAVLVSKSLVLIWYLPHA